MGTIVASLPINNHPFPCLSFLYAINHSLPLAFANCKDESVRPLCSKVLSLSFNKRFQDNSHTLEIEKTMFLLSHAPSDFGQESFRHVTCSNFYMLSLYCNSHCQGILVFLEFLVPRQQTNIQTQGFDPFFNLFSPQFPWLSSVELITKGKFESLSWKGQAVLLLLAWIRLHLSAIPTMEIWPCTMPSSSIQLVFYDMHLFCANSSIQFQWC